MSNLTEKSNEAWERSTTLLMSDLQDERVRVLLRNAYREGFADGNINALEEQLERERVFSA